MSNKSQIAAIIPQPISLTFGEGVFILRSDTRLTLVGNTSLQTVADYLSAFLAPATGYNLKNGGNGENTIILRMDPQLPLGSEGYTLESSSSEIVITGNTPCGVFYGVQTLRQLLPSEIESPTLVSGVTWTVPSVTINDEPRFVWRGTMIDVSRHYFSIEALKRFIDLMALQKLNILQLHLTDDQGWRLEIKKYPKLTDRGSWRTESPKRGNAMSGDGCRYGGFYTQKEMREVVAYATQRFVTIVPEIEMPGHAAAAIAAYPEFGNHDLPCYAPEVQTSWGVKPYTYSPREETFDFLKDILREVMDIFPGPYIHIGGDEAPKDQWKASAYAQQVMKQNGLADERSLQSWFIRRIEIFLNKNGRRLIGWDEIQEGGLSPTATMMVWRDWKWARLALDHGNPIILSPVTHCYFDFYQMNPKMSNEPEAFNFLADPSRVNEEPPITTLDTVYSLDPVPSDTKPGQEKLVLGTQGNLWTEYIWKTEELEYMAFPRLSALAEVGWTSISQKDIKSFQIRLAPLMHRFSILQINCCRHGFESML